MEVTIQKLEGSTSLHLHYPREVNRQPCYLYLDCDEGVLSCRADGNVGGGVSFDVHHGRTLRWSIPCLRNDAANALMESVQACAQRIVDGFSVAWDGNNHKGRFTADADDAREELAGIVDAASDPSNGAEVQAWDADDWLCNGWIWTATHYGITSSTTDEELSEVEDKVNQDAASEGIDVLHGLTRHLEWVRDQCRESD